MSLIHDRRECLTGCQDRSPWSPRTDLRYDFIMVYGVDASMPERVRVWRERGYVVHLMTGAAWGDYQDYLDGTWDGREHWDESQCDRQGRPILHGVGSPYFCPSPSFGRYLLEKLKPAVDAGVEAVHLEEPEFWDAGGYGAEFRRAWQDFYGEPWQPPHASCDARYRASALKVHLFRRLIAFVSAGLKAYAAGRGKRLSFYVPTHSLLNYTQWKILSPEGSLLDVPTVDGFIAQVWTGTARVGHVFRGQYGERVFETAFLEYGIARELVRGSDRRIWFLHDPVEDNPEYTWADFRDNYLKTVTASLMFPDVFRYEVSPWPDRVFNGVYPKKGRLAKEGFLPGEALKGARPIPPDYAELIATLIQTLGDMNQPCSALVPGDPGVGLLMADSGLCQRSFPDGVAHGEGGVEGLNRRFVSLMDGARAGRDVREEARALMAEIEGDPALFLDYVASGPFPHFFGLAMPLVRAGIPLHPVQLESLTRPEGLPRDLSVLILSYEWMKPRDPGVHDVLADWVRKGGTLVYAGDGADPYHAAGGWWNAEGAPWGNPARHLFDRLGLGPDPEEGCFSVGGGRVVVRKISPARVTLSPEASDAWLRLVLEKALPGFAPRNYFLMRRGPYRIAAVMADSVSPEPLVLKGHFVDLFAAEYDLLTEKTVRPGETALLCDLDAVGADPVRPVASTARLEELRETASGWELSCVSAEGVRIRLLLRLARRPRVKTLGEEGQPLEPEICRWDESTRTLLLRFPAPHRRISILLSEM